MNLYVHFPFCRSKCSYCALHSRPGVPEAERNAYVRSLAVQVRALPFSRFSTVYFGGGSPALCELKPILDAIAPHLTPGAEFTVEMHPLDVTDDLLSRLRDGGVNRISMGVQSFDDATLAAMGRGYSIAEAVRAFSRVRRRFENAGIDLIVGYPNDPCDDFTPLADWGLAHVSVYSLQNERNLANVPDDDWILDRIRDAASFLSSIGLRRYEISNYAKPGRECRHNMAVWRGEDYVGLGEGACGRLGLRRTRGKNPSSDGGPWDEETVTAEQDALERRIFRLRTREGLDASGRSEWRPTLREFCREGLLVAENEVYRLTSRGAEVCDTILASLV